MGLPIGAILNMPERDLRAYADYAAEFGLPNQRIEWYAAQQAYVSAASLGGYKGKFSDFLLKTNDQAETPEQEVDVFANFEPD